MKFEKIAESIISILKGLRYDYKMYSKDRGQRTSNPYKARYFFVSNPNLMFIVDKTTNTITIHKSGMSFAKFKPILKLLRSMAKRYMVNLEIQNYNSNFVPKDFASDIQKQNSRVEQSVSESVNKNNNILKETYINESNTVEVYNNNKTTKYVLNSTEGFELPITDTVLTPYIVEHINQNDHIDRDYIIKLYQRYEKYAQLHESSKHRYITAKERLLLKELDQYFK